MEVRHKSAIPIYIAGAVWVLYSIIFPMHKLIHIIIAAILFILAFFLSGRFFPDRIEMVEEPIKYTGAKDADMAIAEGNRYIEKMRKANNRIQNAVVSEKIDILSEVIKRYLHISPRNRKRSRIYADLSHIFCLQRLNF